MKVNENYNIESDVAIINNLSVLVDFHSKNPFIVNPKLKSKIQKNNFELGKTIEVLNSKLTNNRYIGTNNDLNFVKRSVTIDNVQNNVIPPTEDIPKILLPEKKLEKVHRKLIRDFTESSVVVFFDKNEKEEHKIDEKKDQIQNQNNFNFNHNNLLQTNSISIIKKNMSKQCLTPNYNDEPNLFKQLSKSGLIHSTDKQKEFVTNFDIRCDKNKNKIEIGIEQKKKKIKLSNINQDIYSLLALSSIISDEINNNFKLMINIPETNQEEILNRKIALEPVGKKLSNKTLILDLDDTLIHALDKKRKIDQKDLNNLEINSSYYIDKKSGQKRQIQFIIRPYALTFLQDLTSFYELIIFTASEKNYADSIIDKLDPQNNIIDYRLYRNHCILKKNLFIKNLNIFSNRDLKNIVIVDNLIPSFKDNFANGIHIKTFVSDAKDRELIKLSDYLKSIMKEDDLRIPITKDYNLEQMYQIYLRSNLPKQKVKKNYTKIY